MLIERANAWSARGKDEDDSHRGRKRGCQTWLRIHSGGGVSTEDMDMEGALS